MRLTWLAPANRWRRQERCVCAGDAGARGFSLRCDRQRGGSAVGMRPEGSVASRLGGWTLAVNGLHDCALVAVSPPPLRWLKRLLPQPVARLATSSTLDVLARVHDDGGLAALRRHRERDHLAVLQHTLHLIAHKHTTLSSYCSCKPRRPSENARALDPQLAANLPRSSERASYSRALAR